MNQELHTIERIPWVENDGLTYTEEKKKKQHRLYKSLNQYMHTIEAIASVAIDGLPWCEDKNVKQYIVELKYKPWKTNWREETNNF